MIWAHQLDLIQSARSSYYHCNYTYIVCIHKLNNHCDFFRHYEHRILDIHVYIRETLWYKTSENNMFYVIGRDGVVNVLAFKSKGGLLDYLLLQALWRDLLTKVTSPCIWTKCSGNVKPQLWRAHISCLMTKPTKWQVRPAKAQISLGIRSVWSEYSLSAWRYPGSLATHWVHNEDSDQTGRMPRLIWVFAGRTVILYVSSWDGSVILFVAIIVIKLNGIIYNDSLYTTDLYISAYNILVCETIVDHDQQRL